MNALKLSATRRRNQVVILNCLQSKPTPLSTSRKRSGMARRLLTVAAAAIAVIAIPAASVLAAADVTAGKVALALFAMPVVYFCMKGGDK